MRLFKDTVTILILCNNICLSTLRLVATVVPSITSNPLEDYWVLNSDIGEVTRCGIVITPYSAVESDFLRHEFKWLDSIVYEGLGPMELPPQFETA